MDLAVLGAGGLVADLLAGGLAVVGLETAGGLVGGVGESLLDLLLSGLKTDVSIYYSDSWWLIDRTLVESGVIFS